MEPIPETLRAVEELDVNVNAEEGDLLEGLTAQAARARGLAPQLVGVSVAARALGVTFTLVATDEETAGLDAMQYLSSGPCVEALESGQGIATGPADFLSEGRWQALGQATAAAGIRSTLTFPIVDAEAVVGTVNLYGRSDDAFAGKHEQLASVFRAWAPGAVTNADLAFSTRRLAEQAPGLLREQALIDTATGIVAAAHEVDVDTALEYLLDAAERAGLPLIKLARVIIVARQS